VPHDVHDFHEQKRFAESVRVEAFWIDIYRRAFPDMVSCHLNARDNGAQRAGVDRLILLRSTKMLHIDEKVRKVVRDDILLEYLSNDETQALGWIEKDLTIDYLAYAMLPALRCYLFPWQMLRRAWLAHRERWIAYGRRRERGFSCPPPARNKGYRTHSVCVPIKTLREVVSAAHVIQLDPGDPLPPDPASPLKQLAFTRDGGAQQSFDFGGVSRQSARRHGRG